MSFLNIRTLIVITIYCLMLAPQVYAQFNVVIPGVSLGGGITADIQIDIFDNTSSFCASIDPERFDRHTIFAVHGVNSNAFVFQPLAAALFNNTREEGIVCRVLGINMPGHGGSGLPQGGMLFGEMTQQNYANVLIDTLDRISADFDVQPVAIMTHSNGGIVTSLAQQTLANAGSSLQERFGIEKVTFMAPPPTAPVLWPSQIERRNTAIFRENCLEQGAFAPGDPCENIDVVGPPGVITWEDIIALEEVPIQYDCNPDTVPIGNPMVTTVPPMGAIAQENCIDPPDNPLGDHVLAGFLGGPEPEALALNREALGFPPQQRPVTDSGIFAGPTFSVISFQDDIVVGPSEVTENFFNHLSGSTGTNKFRIATGPTSDHVMLFTDPQGMLEQVQGPNDICFIPVEPRAVPTLSEWGLISIALLFGIIGILVLRKRKVLA